MSAHFLCHSDPSPPPSTSSTQAEAAMGSVTQLSQALKDLCFCPFSQLLERSLAMRGADGTAPGSPSRPAAATGRERPFMGHPQRRVTDLQGLVREKGFCLQPLSSSIATSRDDSIINGGYASPPPGRATSCCHSSSAEEALPSPSSHPGLKCLEAAGALCELSILLGN